MRISDWSSDVCSSDLGNRVHREYIDEETGKPVEREQQVKGYETGEDQYVILQPEEIAEVVPESDKVIRIEAFLPCPEVDTVYFDKPYYLAPPDGVLGESFARSEEHTSELQSLMRISYDVFCLKK